MSDGLRGAVAPRSYFTRINDSDFRATEHVGGAWATHEQHIAPALGLLAHAIEVDRDSRRDDALQLARLSYDILGTFPIDVVSVEVTVARAGRSVELVEARLSHAGRTALVARAWLMKGYETAAFAGSAFARIPSPEAAESWDPTDIWPGGFVESVEVRRSQREPGRAVVWVRTDVALIDGEPVSVTARNVGLLDLANGMTPRVSAEEFLFPNVDLTVHFFQQAHGEWLGFDTTVALGSTGLGLTESTIHDVNGPVGTMSQCLTVRPRP